MGYNLGIARTYKGVGAVRTTVDSGIDTVESLADTIVYVIGMTPAVAVGLAKDVLSYFSEEIPMLTKFMSQE